MGTDDRASARSGGWGTRAVGAVAAITLSVIAVVYYGQAPSADALAGESSQARASSVSRAAEPSSTESDPPSSSPSEEPSPTDPADAPVGPGTTATGTLLRVAPARGGGLDVEEVVRAARPFERVVLRAPRVRAAGSGFVRARPRAIEVQLMADGQPVVVPKWIRGRAVTIVLSVPASQLSVRYLLVGTTVRSKPSTTGRALAAVAPLVRTPNDLPVMVLTSGEAVRNIACPLLRGNAQACAAGDRGAMRLREPLARRTALALLQLDLPSP